MDGALFSSAAPLTGGGAWLVICAINNLSMYSYFLSSASLNDMGDELPYSPTSRLTHTIDYLITLT